MNICACMGKQKGDQYCPCLMESKGLDGYWNDSVRLEKEKQELNEALKKLGWE